MSDREIDIIINKLERLTYYLEHLKGLSGLREELVIENGYVFGAAERYLQLAIEVVLDLGKLLCIHMNFQKPENSHEVFEILFKNKIISRHLFEKIRGMPGFRNILVHDYMKIDRRIVYKALKSSQRDFVLYSKAILRAVR